MARKELNSEDLPLRELPPIGDDMQDFVRGDEVVVATETDIAEKDYLAELAFMQEVVNVIIHKGREKNAQMFIPLGVNGNVRYFPVEEEIPMKRCFLEVLARAQPMDVETRVEDEDKDNPVNRIIRSSRSLYPFTVMRDPNPKGHAWLAKIMREG